ncbi:MAG: hypothetical protein NT154_35565 [Verrucomicrobia bacterium]|nr:hypothetical protein [Verrucomicrobiota bacterium]
MQTTKPGNFETVNVAVVGLGFMGVTHLRAYLEAQGARIVAALEICEAEEKSVRTGQVVSA